MAMCVLIELVTTENNTLDWGLLFKSVYYSAMLKP